MATPDINVSLDECKTYLKVAYTTVFDDEINLFIPVANKFIQEDLGNERVDFLISENDYLDNQVLRICVLILVADMFKNRGSTTRDNQYLAPTAYENMICKVRITTSNV